MKAYGFTMKRGNVTIETFVYSEHGKDIENRFPEWKVSDIKEIPDPVSQNNAGKQSRTRAPGRGAKYQSIKKYRIQDPSKKFYS